ncbi:MAG: hypothetical protein COB23_07150 [Methylophaga sp.]|nr:MAG: hypothetical protein COB23_07150 [Methylophaga sp.]
MSTLKRRVDKLAATKEKDNLRTLVILEYGETEEHGLIRTGNQDVDIDNIFFVSFVEASDIEKEKMSGVS